MVDYFHIIAKRFHKLKSIAIILAIMFLIFIIGIIFSSSGHQGDFFLIPSIVIFSWCLLAYMFLIVFQYIPNRANEGDKFLVRAKVKTHRSLYWLFGVGFIVILIFTLAKSISMIAVWGRDFIV